MVVIMQVAALDTNIFIYYFQKHPEFGPFVKPLFNSLVLNELKAVTSIIDVNERIALETAHIRRSYGFRLPDSIQLATALYAKAEVFITNDKRLSGFKELKVKLLSE